MTLNKLNLIPLTWLFFIAITLWLLPLGLSIAIVLTVTATFIIYAAYHNRLLPKNTWPFLKEFFGFCGMLALLAITMLVLNHFLNTMFI